MTDFKQFKQYKEWCEYLNILPVDTRFNSFYNEHYQTVAAIIKGTQYPKPNIHLGYGVTTNSDSLEEDKVW